MCASSRPSSVSTRMYRLGCSALHSAGCTPAASRSTRTCARPAPSPTQPLPLRRLSLAAGRRAPASRASQRPVCQHALLTFFAHAWPDPHPSESDVPARRCAALGGTGVKRRCAARLRQAAGAHGRAAGLAAGARGHPVVGVLQGHARGGQRGRRARRVRRVDREQLRAHAHRRKVRAAGRHQLHVGLQPAPPAARVADVARGDVFWQSYTLPVVPLGCRRLHTGVRLCPACRRREDRRRRAARRGGYTSAGSAHSARLHGQRTTRTPARRRPRM